MADLSGQTFDGFTVRRRIGAGGMGSVYEAHQAILERTVAIKTMAPDLAGDAEYVARFQREAASAAMLSHPNIVQVYTAGIQDGEYYIAMEYVEGETVEDRLERLGRLAPDDAVAIALYVARALDYAWETAHLIHRDIKPQNIFLSNAGAVKLGDLGLAKVVTAGATSMTTSGMVMGTPDYISPEQARGEADIDFRADIYSLGCALFHMLTGRPPYRGNSAVEVMSMHLTAAPPALSKAMAGCPRELALVVHRMMARDRTRRYPNYAALLRDLGRLYDLLEQAKAPGARPHAAVRRSSASRSPLPVALLIGLAVLTVAGALVGVAMKQRNGRRSTAASKPNAGLRRTDPVPLPSREPVADATPSSDGFSPALTPADLAFAKEVAALPPEQQVARVAARLAELNPGFDPKGVTHEIKNDVVVTIKFRPNLVSDISPVRALFGLKKFDAYGNDSHSCRLVDLTPLRGLQLDKLYCGYTGVRDLAPLQGMPLTELKITACPVVDLSPLQGMQLTSLSIGSTQVRDLAPLRDMPLRMLYLGDLRFDLSPLAHCPLTDLQVKIHTPDDLRVLRSIGSLRKINTRSADDFWKLVDARDYVTWDGKIVPAAEFWKQVDAQAVSAPPPAPVRRAGETTVVDLGGGVSFELAWCPPGEFIMGSPPDEFGRETDETQHRVRLTKGFWIGRTEVTQAVWERVMGFNPSGFKNPRNPVERVQWGDCREFVAKLNDLVPGGGFRMPTEAEWEYACRAGTTSALNSGKALTALDTCPNLDHVAWYNANNDRQPHPVGLKKANAWGLYDTHGNVSEWCLDRWDAYADSPVTDPLSPPSTTCSHVLRGGGWKNTPATSRSASRSRLGVDDVYSDNGFRLARSEPESAAPSPDASPSSVVFSPTLTPADLAFVKEVVALPPEQQVARVLARLAELNPGFDPKDEKHEIRGGTVVSLYLRRPSMTAVTNLAPVRALVALKSLTCGGFWEAGWAKLSRSKLSSLAQLRGLSLSELRAELANIDDLSPLADMPLQHLDLFSNGRLRSLAPLTNTPLKFVNVNNTSVLDLTPLAGKAIKRLEFGRTAVSDIEPLRTMTLESLYMESTPVSDAAPLAACTNIVQLNMKGTKITDIKPLRGLPLAVLDCDFVPERDAEILRSIKTLERINGMPVAEFWKQAD